MTETIAAPTGAALIAALREAKVEFVAAVPDIWTSAGFLWPLSKEPSIRLIRLCKEDEGVSICSGLAYTNHRAVLSMQSTGLLDSINAIRSIAVSYSQPICMLVGLLGRKEHLPIDDAAQDYSVSVVPKLMDAMGVKTVTIDRASDVALIAPAIEAAYAESKPVVMFIARSVTAA